MSSKLPGIKLFDLTGRTAMITGGSKGLGYAMAAALASAGCNVVLVNRNKVEGDDAAKQISKDFGVQAHYVPADVTNEKQVVSMTETTLGLLGKIDILIN